MAFRRLLIVALVAACGGWTSEDLSAEITPARVRDAIAAGVRFLKSQQRAQGGWTERPGQPGGISALCTLALLESGEPVDSPVLQKALAYQRSLGDPRATYSAALQTMVFCAASPEKDRLLIRRNAQWLANHQIQGGARAGAWTYFHQISERTRGDNSNSQFALLGMHEAEQVGVKISDEVWQRTLAYWHSCQTEDGAWTYYKSLPNEPKAPQTGSMTCAGIAACVIAQGRASQGDASVVGGTVRCCGQQQDLDRVERGLQWLGQHFTVSSNPRPLSARGFAVAEEGLFYYLYGLERVGRLTGRRFIGGHDWYREGAEWIVGSQDSLSGFWVGIGHGENNKLIATSFALLFLSKGRRPVVMSKLKHGADNDWDHHRSGVPNLTRDIERRWKQKLTWQTVDVRAASLADLLESPVLFISGRDSLDLTDDQKQNLRNYVNQGGFIFAESCCEGQRFDARFRALMKELFPDSSLRLMPPDHPIWYAEQRVNPSHLRPLYGIDACCRTSVVYCPKDLSCLWELSQGTRDTGYPRDVQDDIDACLAIGANVVAYATNRQLKDKLDRPQIAVSDANSRNAARGVLSVVKLSHPGGADDAPNSLANLLKTVGAQGSLRLNNQKQLLSPTDPTLFDHPISFLHGRRAFQFTAAERKSLATYLRRGGFIFGDAICASRQFADSVRREIKAAIPEANFVRLAEDHPVFSKEFGGYDLATVTLRDPQARAAADPLSARLTKVKPYLEGVTIDGRIAVLFSPYDISCAMENQASLDCKGYIKEDAARLGTNILLFALQQ